MEDAGSIPDDMAITTELIAQIFSTGLPTRTDIVKIVEYYVSDISYEERSKVLFYIENAIIQRGLDISLVLVSACGLIKNRLYFPIIAFCLRKGADPNLYVDSSNSPYFNANGISDSYPVHILVYLISSMNSNGILNPELFEIGSLIFVYFGSRLVSPAYRAIADEKRKKYQDMDDIDPELATVRARLREVGNIRDYTVSHYVSTQYNFDIPKINTIPGLSEDTQKILGIYVDDPELALRDEVAPVIEDLIMTRSINIIKKLNILPLNNPDPSPKYSFVNFIKGQTIALERATASIFREFWEVLIDVGVLPNYFDINYLIVYMLLSEDPYTIAELRNMLLYAIERGACVEENQLILLNMNFQDVVRKKYAEPFWIKESRTNAPKSDRFNRLSVYLSLDLNDSKKTISSTLAQLAKENPEDLIKASKKRQSLRRSVELGIVEDFTGDEIPRFDIYNKDYIFYDLDLYNDIQIAYFHEEGKLYAFTSERYESLLSRNINPVSGKQLPPFYSLKLSYLLNVMKRIGINPVKVVPFDSALEIMKEPDEISNSRSEEIKTTMRSAYTIRGIKPSDIESMSADYLNAKLKILDMDQIYLQYLSGDVLIDTFYRAAFSGLEKNKDRQDINSIFFTI